MCAMSLKQALIALPIAGHWSVRIADGGCPPISFTNSLNAHIKLAVVSLVRRTPANKIDWKWLLTPTNIPKGISYEFVW
uniref:Uncharacterized protein n=1 Tax=Arundo donax TaxID=35708 RepID=A0A0A9CVR6_ARUDO